MSQSVRDLFQSDEARKIREFNDRLTAEIRKGEDSETCGCCGVPFIEGQRQCPHKGEACE